VLAAVLTPLAANAQTQWDVLFHGSGLAYSDSRLKENGYVAGFYGTYGAGWKHLVELGATWTRINYLDGSALEQGDLSAAYSRFGARGAGRIGAHVILTTDSLTDRGLVLFGGGSVYQPGVWSVGAEGAWSSFPNYGDGLNAVQVAPSLGFSIADGTGTQVVGATLRGYYIHLSGDVGLRNQDFLSAEAAVSFTFGAVTLSGYAWGGEQAFAVRSGGFVSFNLSELHTGGYGGGLRWVVTPRSAISAGLYIERFQDEGFLADATVRTLSASLGFTL
jgi:hypothetical protein